MKYFPQTISAANEIEEERKQEERAKIKVSRNNDHDHDDYNHVAGEYHEW